MTEKVQGMNFTCVHAGSKEGWSQFRLEPPVVPRPTSGKLFLMKLLESACLAAFGQAVVRFGFPM